MFFTTTVLLFISMASQSAASFLSSFGVRRVWQTPYRCFNVKTETNGIEFPQGINSTFQLPDPFIVGTKAPSPSGKLYGFIRCNAHGNKTTNDIQSNQVLKFRPFIVFGNETFKFEYPYCHPDDRMIKSGKLSCKEGKWTTKVFNSNAEKASTVKKWTRILMQFIGDEKIYFKFSLKCRKIGKEEYLQRIKENDFEAYSPNDNLALCQNLKQDYCKEVRCDKILQGNWSWGDYSWQLF
jgi:hypothetical protein